MQGARTYIEMECFFHGPRTSSEISPCISYLKFAVTSNAIMTKLKRSFAPRDNRRRLFCPEFGTISSRNDWTTTKNENPLSRENLFVEKRFFVSRSSPQKPQRIYRESNGRVVRRLNIQLNTKRTRVITDLETVQRRIRERAFGAGDHPRLGERLHGALEVHDRVWTYTNCSNGFVDVFDAFIDVAQSLSSSRIVLGYCIRRTTGASE